MTCLLCGAGESRTVWRQDFFRIDRCGGCGVLFAVNPPTQGELNTLYEKGFLTGSQTENLGRENGPPPDWKQSEQMALLGRVKRLGINGGALLDVGAFSGMFMQNAKLEGFDATGVEPILDAFRYTTGTLGLKVIHGDLFSAALPAESFDVVSLLDVIEHVRDPVAELQETFRVLKPGGILVMTTPNVAGLMQRIVGTKRKMFGEAWCPIDDVPWHLWGFTPATFRTCMTKSGFHVEAVESLEPSTLSTNRNSGSTRWKKIAVLVSGEASKILRMSDRMVGFARKRADTKA
jgi:SAM-dependent methyltransferase